MNGVHMATPSWQPIRDPGDHRIKDEAVAAVLRFQYLPPASLSKLDMQCELGLERLLYLQALITEDSEL